MIRPLGYALRIVAERGTIAAEFHQWLKGLSDAVSSTYIADQSPARNLVIRDGQFGIHAKRLTVAGKERLEIAGTGRLVICG